MPSNKYFNVDEFITHICKEYDISREGKLFFMAAPRNIGKSYSAWAMAIKKYMRKNSKIAYMRIQDTQLKLARADFNDSYDNFICQGDVIYAREKYIDEYRGEEIEKYKRTDIVGYFLSINNYINAKSGKFDNIDFVFVDEINEDTSNNIGLYDKAVSLFTTVIRKNRKAYVLMLANRDSANNDFMVRWGIDERTPDEYLTDIVYRVSPNIFYCELSDKWYLDLENDKSLFHEMAQFSNKALRQLSGGYGTDFSRQVKNFKKWIEPTFKPQFGLVINQLKYYYGTFIFKSEIKKAFVSAENRKYENIKFYAIDTLSAAINDSVIPDVADVEEIYELFFYEIKSLTLFFDLFDTQTIFNLSLKTWGTNFFKK